MFDLTPFWEFVRNHQAQMGWVAVLSFVLFVGCLGLGPLIAVKIPADYFLGEGRPRMPFADRHPIVRWIGLILKNMIGVVLLVAGILMLILPGQGILTMVVGILMLDFPGKHRLERGIVRLPPVLSSLNWFRHRAGVDPIELDGLCRDRDHLAANSNQSSATPHAEKNQSIDEA